MRRFLSVLFLFGFSALPIIAELLGSPTPDREIFIAEGKARALFETGTPWEAGDGFLEGAKENNDLYALKGLGPGDFTIKLRVALKRFEGSAASFFLNQDHFGFDGRKKRFYLQGPYFGRTRFIADAEKWIVPGRPFDFEAVRKGRDLFFRIDGREVCRVRFHRGFAGQFGLRPFRGSLRVSELSATGDLVPLPETREVFAADRDGYASCRFPSLLRSGEGTLFAFCEGRKDSGEAHILLKRSEDQRSEDQGITWSKPQVIWNLGKGTCTGPCTLMDRSSGTIWLVTTVMRDAPPAGGDGEHAEKSEPHIYILSSTDGCNTWSPPEEVTKAVSKSEWSVFGTSPGRGIQMTGGPLEDLLVFPCFHGQKTEPITFSSHVIISDDHGKTWRATGTTEKGSRNCQVVERGEGILLLNMERAGGGKEPYRLLAASINGGISWSRSAFDRALIDPAGLPGILRYAPFPGLARPVMAISNQSHKTKQIGLMLRLSFDEGWAWPVGRLICPGPCGASSLAPLDKGRIACLFEVGKGAPFEKIVLANLEFPELTPPGNP